MFPSIAPPQAWWPPVAIVLSFQIYLRAASGDGRAVRGTHAHQAILSASYLHASSAPEEKEGWSSSRSGADRAGCRHQRVCVSGSGHNIARRLKYVEDVTNRICSM